MQVLVYSRLAHSNVIEADKADAVVTIELPDTTPLTTIKELVGACSEVSGTMLTDGKQDIPGLAAVVEL